MSIPFQTLHAPGPSADAGLTLGRALAPMLESRRVPYLADLMSINRVTPDQLREQTRRWLAALPTRFQVQMDAMALGAGLSLQDLAEFLYVDIASTSSPWARGGPLDDSTLDDPTDNPAAGPAAGPLCTGFVTPLHNRPWLARNCDWYKSLLVRGTSATFYAEPNLIPCVSLGVAGDIDIDTGFNAERLWLHMHTLHATDPIGPGQRPISWLFWMRDCLERCSTIDEVDRFIAQTARDRGVVLFAVDGKSGESAVFECHRTRHDRFEPLTHDDPTAGPAGSLIATNHCRCKHPQETLEEQEHRGRQRAGSTIRRYNRVRRLLELAPPEEGPDDLIEILADDQVEMRTPEHLRTIYSAVCDPTHNRLWFASGALPAASAGAWREIKTTW